MTYIARVVIASPIRGFPREPANLMFLWPRLRLRWTKASGHSGLRQDAEQTRLTVPVNQQIQDARDYRIYQCRQTSISRAYRYCANSKIFTRFGATSSIRANHKAHCETCCRCSRRFSRNIQVRAFTDAVTSHLANLHTRNFVEKCKSQKCRSEDFILIVSKFWRKKARESLSNRNKLP